MTCQTKRLFIFRLRTLFSSMKRQQPKLPSRSHNDSTIVGSNYSIFNVTLHPERCHRRFSTLSSAEAGPAVEKSKNVGKERKSQSRDEKRLDKLALSKLNKLSRFLEIPGENKIRIRLIDEHGNNAGIMSKSEARKLAFAKELRLADLPKEDPAVESSSATNEENLPVCVLMSPTDYNRHEKQEKAQRKLDNMKQFSGKHSLRFTTSLGEAHVESKFKQITGWLEKRCIVDILINTAQNEETHIARKTEIKDALISRIGDKAKIDITQDDESMTKINVSPIV